MDKACLDSCPIDCIYYEEDIDRKLYIHPEECIDCAACEDTCPVTAIFPVEDLPADQAVYEQIDADWFEDKQKARQAVARLALASG
ncbi:MAG: ferredoxin family protein [Bacteroidetes bacterium]|nr:ferredoxin family protein [Bacteroidota bacterium]